jgi:NAD(P)-dependent dehydrogenase (short-subunit alcohol dehydrogenase family)
MAQIKERTALITGAARGIGRSIALALAQRGVRVAVTARSKDLLDALAEEIGSLGGSAVAIPADLEKPGEPCRVLSQAVAFFGPVGILVNNAALVSAWSPKLVVDYDDEFWQRSLMLNLTVPYLLSKGVLPAMIAAGSGRIINIASVVGKIGCVRAAAYSATKHGLIGLTRTLALETAPLGVTVNAICPGPTATEANDRRLHFDADRLGKRFEELLDNITPMRRRDLTEEVASRLLVLVSEEASAITGQSYHVDCGSVMS